MAPDRSFNVPQSHDEEAFRTSPFHIHQADVAALQSCEAFQAIHSSLVKQHKSVFCTYHRPSARHDEEAWLLQRDITHALILPVLWIYRYASTLAHSLLGDRNIFDLELVFRGEARGAFAWLQCFVVEEHDWCLTRGCPGCVVSHVLQAEPTIRIALVAGRLSQSLRRTFGDGGPIPTLDFWSSTLRQALDEDIFWGPIFWEDIDARASWLEHGIQELVQQCFELESLVPGSKFGRSTPIMVGAFSYEGSVKSLKAQSPLMANTTTPTNHDGDDWMTRILLASWNSHLADAVEMEAQSALSIAQLQTMSDRSYPSSH